MRVTEYQITANVPRNLKIVHLSDIHGRYSKRIINATAEVKPDFIAVTGDLCEIEDINSDKTLTFLGSLSEISKVFYSLGNHEKGIVGDDISKIRSTGVVLLDDEYVSEFGISIGGLTSGFFSSPYGSGKKNPDKFNTPKPNLRFIKRFSSVNNFKLLLCHHPEYYRDYLKDENIDLILSGHAHGGQINMFGKGMIAPGQGFFPEYTNGIYDNRLVISRGLSNTVFPIPRLFNPKEIVVINLIKDSKQ